MPLALGNICFVSQQAYLDFPVSQFEAGNMFRHIYYHVMLKLSTLLVVTICPRVLFKVDLVWTGQQ